MSAPQFKGTLCFYYFLIYNWLTKFTSTISFQFSISFSDTIPALLQTMFIWPKVSFVFMKESVWKKQTRIKVIDILTWCNWPHINNRTEWCNLATGLYQPAKSVPVIAHFSHKLEVLTSKHYIWPDMLTRLSCYNVKHIYMCIYIFIYDEKKGVAMPR